MTEIKAGAASRQFRSGFDAALRPGFALPRLGALMSRALTETLLDLSELTVLTEAATGAYAVTAVLAAMAGARHVYAFTRPTRHGTPADARQQTLELADSVGVADRIDVLEQITPDILHQTDIVTNSGHLRPITAALIDMLPKEAVIALMFEAWEFRPKDLDMEACLRRGIPIVGVNERHPSVDVFSFLGPLCVKQLHDCGLSVYKNRIAVLCDNDFVGSLRAGLASSGASVDTFDNVQAVYRDKWDAIIVALRPAAEPRIGSPEAMHLAACAPAGAIIVQFWGDIDRTALSANGLGVWPTTPPALGHMGILLSEIGPDPIVRLQAGGLRAAEWVRRSRIVSADGFAQLVTRSPDPVFASSH
ncbi:hypothetical protein ML401_19080 [Bradyrhizobium sp. 62B]|uniref:hypothetical protein n=1 Tax=Bradyrhizobium TaxID=374 RepID=UPI00216A39AA|nr:hypothetical protein [Bradyrhizobium centrosematis]MCS3759034.1 hypothetical protein [Bradyrhizobium centrosematis]MCS3773078.1 hypothetical protein [Bradyrhizobium centrosematis]WIW43628.1 hypothetical protein ML401_19080 [Bradyrhizobium sp. 62B]